MPSTYAHYRMGQQVRTMLDGNEKKIVEKYPQLYLIGYTVRTFYFIISH